MLGDVLSQSDMCWFYTREQVAAALPYLTPEQAAMVRQYGYCYGYEPPPPWAAPVVRSREDDA